MLPLPCFICVTQYNASQTILKYLHHSGLLPDEYVSVGNLTDWMVDDGMSLDEFESGLVLALRSAWLQSVDDYIGLTEEGFKRFEPANDNTGIRLIP
jgi:hypothetical protein